MASFLTNNSGQTSLEYLLLLSAAFVSAYLIVTQPLGSFTIRILSDIRGGIQSTVKDGEWKRGGGAESGVSSDHPNDPSRKRALHL